LGPAMAGDNKVMRTRTDRRSVRPRGSLSHLYSHGLAEAVRRTKILVTIGPASCSREGLIALARAGADSFRLNFSHGSDPEHRAWLQRMRFVRAHLGREIPIVGDVQGPKIRIGALTPEPISLVEGAFWTIDESDRPGDAHRIGAHAPGLMRAARPGDPILLGDGGVELSIVRVDRHGIRARVVHGGLVRSHAGLFLPRAHLRTRVLGPKDLHDIEIAVAEGIDFLAVSFVRDANDLRLARATLDRLPGGDRVGLIAKIERAEALDAIDEILVETDAIMVARGDLGIEVPLERLALAQKMLLRKANLAARPAIVATQMLLSMVHAPRPTRAEATDVANAVLDGADAVMLSEESAIGDYPADSVRWLARIAEATEDRIPSGPREGASPTRLPAISPEREVASATVQLAHDLGARAIVTPTHSGRSATLVSALRPKVPIIALSAVPETRRRLGLVWGVQSQGLPKHTLLSSLRDRAAQIARELEPLPGRVILTAGYPVEGRPTNLVTVVEPESVSWSSTARARRPGVVHRGGPRGTSRGRRTPGGEGTRS